MWKMKDDKLQCKKKELEKNREEEEDREINAAVSGWYVQRKRNNDTSVSSLLFVMIAALVTRCTCVGDALLLRW